MGISESILAEWKRQATADGKLEDYEYHLGMIYPPLPYLKWKMKVAELERIQSAPGYMDNTGNIPRENQLCNELGY